MGIEFFFAAFDIVWIWAIWEDDLCCPLMSKLSFLAIFVPPVESPGELADW